MVGGTDSRNKGAEVRGSSVLRAQRLVWTDIAATPVFFGLCWKKARAAWAMASSLRSTILVTFSEVDNVPVSRLTCCELEVTFARRGHRRVRKSGESLGDAAAFRLLKTPTLEIMVLPLSSSKTETLNASSAVRPEQDFHLFLVTVQASEAILVCLKPPLAVPSR